MEADNTAADAMIVIGLLQYHMKKTSIRIAFFRIDVLHGHTKSASVMDLPAGCVEVPKESKRITSSRGMPTLVNVLIQTTVSRFANYTTTGSIHGEKITGRNNA